MYRKNGSKEQNVKLDFTSALYLGIKHDTNSLKPWSSFTTGAPAALKEPPAARQIAKAIAGIQGMDEGLLYPSTLHLFLDLFENLNYQRNVIFIDRKAYPIAKWGMQGALKKKNSVFYFNHSLLDGLSKEIHLVLKGRRPIIVTDSWCLECNKAAPVNKYLKILRPYDGLLVMDDTQALGILGRQPNNKMPYGYGGGGVVPWLGIQDENIILGSSLAKAFGAPVAVLSGSSKIIQQVKERSLSRVHCSPPSMANIQSAWHALNINHIEGDYRRYILLQRIRQFKKGLQEESIKATKGIFPVLKVITSNSAQSKLLLKKLKKKGVQAILTVDQQKQTQVTFLFRADHLEEEVYHTLNIITRFFRKSQISRISRTRTNSY